MEMDYATVPGTGRLHHGATRRGQRLGVLVEFTGRRRLMFYDARDPDSAIEVLLDDDEAAMLAQLLQPDSAADRLADLERRITDLVPQSR